MTDVSRFRELLRNKKAREERAARLAWKDEHIRKFHTNDKSTQDVIPKGVK